MATESRADPTSKSEGTSVTAPCSTCGRPTRHVAIKAIEYSSEYRDGDFTIDAWDNYQIIECQGCQTISFRHLHQDSEDLEPAEDGDGLVPSDSIKLYPSRVAGRRALENAHLLPWAIKRIYDETREVLGSGLHVLAGIGLRALVEAVCNERQATGKQPREAYRRAGVSGCSHGVRRRDSPQPSPYGERSRTRGKAPLSRRPGSRAGRGRVRAQWRVPPSEAREQPA